MRLARRLGGSLVITSALVVGGATSAWACGFLVSPTGAVQLQRTTTLAAYHDGVEHYITSFQFGTAEESFGSIIPLPDVPTKVERAGDWTLQRLRLESERSGLEQSAVFATAGGSTDGARVLLETRVDSLDIVVLEGGGADVVEWAEQNGFSLPDGATEMLEFYATRSPIFMATRFDAAAATADGFVSGDGIPIHVEIPTDDPWVPLKILTLAKPDQEIVEADVFLLTDDRPTFFVGPGVEEQLSVPASTELLDDLRADDNSEWVPHEAWLTHLAIDTPVSSLGYDLAISANGGEPDVVDTGLFAVPSLPSFGLDLERASDTPDPVSLWLVGGFLVVAATVVWGVARRTEPAG